MREADLQYYPKVKDLKDAVYVSEDKELMVKIIDNRLNEKENNN